MSIQFAFGPLVLRWQTDGDPRWDAFERAYAPYAVEAPADLTVHAAIAEPAVADPVLPKSFMRNRTVDGPRFVLGDDLVRGELTDVGEVPCTIHPVLLEGCGLRVLEQFLYLLFRHAVGSGGDAPFLLHCSAAIGPDGAILFVGPSGAGKSTIAGFCPPGRVLTDECAVITPGAAGWRVDGSPINPDFTAKKPGGAPLASILLIDPADRHALRELDPGQAIPMLTAEMIVPIGLLETDSALAMRRALDQAIRLSGAAPVKILEFLPNIDVWDAATIAPSDGGSEHD